MKFVLSPTKTYGAKNRSLKKLPYWKRQLDQKREAKKAELEDLYPVEELIEMGFYDQKLTTQKFLPFGINFWVNTVTCLNREHEWEIMQKRTVSLFLPSLNRLNLIKNIGGRFFENDYSFFWNYNLKSEIMNYWVLFDLLIRIAQLPHWNQVAGHDIPIYWGINKVPPYLVDTLIPRINKRDFRGIAYPKIEFDKSLTLNDLRHNFTPYDYEWQTQKKSREEARLFWNEKISSTWINKGS